MIGTWHHFFYELVADEQHNGTLAMPEQLPISTGAAGTVLDNDDFVEGIYAVPCDITTDSAEEIFRSYGVADSIYIAGKGAIDIRKSLRAFVCRTHVFKYVVSTLGGITDDKSGAISANHSGPKCWFLDIMPDNPWSMRRLKNLCTILTSMTLYGDRVRVLETVSFILSEVSRNTPMFSDVARADANVHDYIKGLAAKYCIVASFVTMANTIAVPICACDRHANTTACRCGVSQVRIYAYNGTDGDVIVYNACVVDALNDGRGCSTYKNSPPHAQTMPL